MILKIVVFVKWRTNTCFYLQSCGEKDMFCYKTPMNTDEPVYSGAPQETESCLGCGFETKDVSKRNLPKTFAKSN